MLQGVLSGFFQLLDPVSILEGVESVLRTATIGGNVANHNGATVSCEGVLQHHGELAAPEGSVVLILIESPDALLQCQ